MIKKRSARMAGLALASVASLWLLAGASPAAAKTKTKTATFSQCLSVAQPILDHQTTFTNFNVAVPKNGKKIQGGIVSDVNAGVRLTHTFNEDLAINLVSPAGTVVALASGRGESSDGYGSGAPSCSGSLVLFDDLFPTPISTTTTTPPPSGTPITGSFKPDQPLASFNTGPARGVWTLLVSDGPTADTGALNAASLTVTYSYKKPVKKKKK
jgi:subtilisin-like proprotein convertase family protein